MPKSTLFDELDRTVDAILAYPQASAAANAKLEPLARIAQELRGLPRQGFKARLNADLKKEIAMTAVESSTTVSTAERYQTLTPYIMHDRAPELAEFLKEAFGAKELSRSIGSAGGFHIEMRIGSSLLMLGGGGKAKIDKPTPTSLHLYLPDVDAVYHRAIAAGATSIEEPVDQSYGDREAGVRDLAGNNWFIATRKGATHIPEGLREVTPFLHPKGADEMIEFLRRAFGAEETAVYRSPEGTIVHGTIKIGDSSLEMGEAHGQWQPMPSAFHLIVGDADSVYQRALEAGATSMAAPANQPYGDRMAWVNDPFGNTWFIASPISK